VVDESTSTVTVLPEDVVRVKVPSPTAFTVPTAAGAPPIPPGPPLPPGQPVPPVPDVPLRAAGWEVREVWDCVEGPVLEAAPATAPPVRTSPRAMAAALVTCTPLRRRRLISGKGSGSKGLIRSCGACSLMVSLLVGGCFTDKYERPA